jgi:hypothetical protein
MSSDVHDLDGVQITELPKPPNARDLLLQKQQVEELSATVIQGLLTERVDLQNYRTTRLKEIGEELKALGYKRPRTKNPNPKPKAANKKKSKKGKKDEPGQTDGV